MDSVFFYLVVAISFLFRMAHRLVEVFATGPLLLLTNHLAVERQWLSHHLTFPFLKLSPHLRDPERQS